VALEKFPTADFCIKAAERACGPVAVGPVRNVLCGTEKEKEPSFQRCILCTVLPLIYIVNRPHCFASYLLIGKTCQCLI
jgi:hypothetical protein